MKNISTNAGLNLLRAGVNGLVVGTMAIATSVVVTATAQAQTTPVDPLEDFRTTDGSDNLFEGDGNNAQNGVFDLIHRMQLSNGMSLDDFNRQRQQNINTEADNFRNLQLQRLRQQQSGSSVDAVAPEQPE